MEFPLSIKLWGNASKYGLFQINSGLLVEISFCNDIAI
jgi:hypothetical protein